MRPFVMRCYVMRCYVMETEGVSPYVGVLFLLGLLLPVFEAHEVVEDGVDGGDEGMIPYVGVPFLLGMLLPVFEAHEVVEDGVDGGAEVVEETRDVEQVLVHPAKCLKRLKKNPIC